jgi:hypothetical protein
MPVASVAPTVVDFMLTPLSNGKFCGIGLGRGDLAGADFGVLSAADKRDAGVSYNLGCMKGDSKGAAGWLRKYKFEGSELKEHFYFLRFEAHPSDLEDFNVSVSAVF